MIARSAGRGNAPAGGRRALAQALLTTFNDSDARRKRMSTIWEMAAIIRAEEARAQTPVAKEREVRVAISVEAPGEVAYWCKQLGTTPMRLFCAIDQVGREPTALRRFLRTRAGVRRLG